MSGKKVFVLALLGLALGYIFIQPEQAASHVNDFLGVLRDGAEGIIEFVKRLFA